MEAMTKDKKIQRMNLSFVKTVAYGGDGMNQEWEDEMSKFLKSHQASYGLMKGYGMTEMAGSVCISNHKFLVMLPLFYDNIKILDIDTGDKKYNCLIKDIKLGIVSRVNHKMLAEILERDAGASAIKR